MFGTNDNDLGTGGGLWEGDETKGKEGGDTGSSVGVTGGNGDAHGDRWDGSCWCCLDAEHDDEVDTEDEEDNPDDDEEEDEANDGATDVSGVRGWATSLIL